MQINLLQELLNLNCDEKLSSNYLTFIKDAILNGQNSQYVENHHILPHIIFPQFSNFKEYPENLAKISAFDHFVAHYYLAKLTNHPGAIYALNCMNRIKHKLSEEELTIAANLYEEFRIKLSRIISKSNKGRTRSPEVIEEISKRFKGTVLVRDSLGKISRVKINDSRYLSGELVFIRTGTKHSKETRQKMRIASKLKGIPHTNKKTQKVKYFPDVQSSEEWVLGIHYTPNQLDKMTSACLDKKFWTNINTGEQIRSKDSPGKDWILGRKKFNNKINDKLAIYNIKTKEYYYKDKKENLSEWEVYKNKHVFILKMQNVTYVHHDKIVLSQRTGIPKEMIDLWGRNNLWGRNEKNILKRSFSSISDKNERFIAMEKFLGKKWGLINLVKMSPHDNSFPKVEDMIWLN